MEYRHDFDSNLYKKEATILMLIRGFLIRALSSHYV